MLTPTERHWPRSLSSLSLRSQTLADANITEQKNDNYEMERAEKKVIPPYLIRQSRYESEV